MKSEKPEFEIGYKFRNLEIISINEEKSKRGWWYDCQCICGEELLVREGDVRGKKVYSCGCKRGQSKRLWGKISHSEVEVGRDLKGFIVKDIETHHKIPVCVLECKDCGKIKTIGKYSFALSTNIKCSCKNKYNYDIEIGGKYDSYTVIKLLDGKYGKCSTKYLCECKCGLQNTLKAFELAGSSHKACIYCSNRKSAIYEEKEEWIEIVCFNGERALIDKEDLDKVKDRSWYVSNTGHVLSRRRKTEYKEGRSQKTPILIHRVIMSPPDDMLVDHINHNTLDNRKSNLRICTSKGNNRNLSLNSSNTSGFKGVYENKAGRWASQIKIRPKTIYLGQSPDIKESAIAYDKAAIKYFGEFAETNYSLGLLTKQDLIDRGETYYEQIDEFKALHS